MMKKTSKPRNERAQRLDVMIIVILVLMSLCTLYPFYNVLILSLSNTVSSAKHPLYVLPYVFDLTGYRTIIADKKFLSALSVSVFVTVVGGAVNMLLSVMGAYVLSRRELIGRKLFLTMIIFTMLFSGGMVPTYLTVKNLGLINSVWAMIVPSAISTYYLIIMKNYFLNFPQGLIEAAKLDGAGEWRVLWQIVVPISKPFMATFLLFYCVERWNEWYNALLYISDTSKQPLQIYLRDILISLNTQLSAQAQQMMGTTQKISTTAVQMAAIIVTAVPIICLYPFLQKYFVNGVMVGGLKE